MRRVLSGVIVFVVAGCAMSSLAMAEDRKEIFGTVVNGLLGGPTAAPDAAYLTQERERLVAMLQSGEYATSRQSEAVDMMVLGVPLTHTAHVYTAQPIPPSQNAR